MPPAKPSVEKRSYGMTVEGIEVNLYKLTNSNGLHASITNYGGIVTELWVPDRRGELGDVVLGYDSLASYIHDSPYFGAIVGRYGNRIANGQFSLDGSEYKLICNSGENHLHGGKKGFDKVLWEAKPFVKNDEVGLQLSYTSVDGEEGYPGTLSVIVMYTLTNNNELRIEYEAKTDQITVINPTHHSYFNLAGYSSGDVLGHTLFIDADRFTPVDAGLIPTGELEAVDGTPMDFRVPTTIGSRINDCYQQLEYGSGYDHNWVLNGDPGELRPVGRVSEPTSGRILELLTTEPGLQFYSGNYLDGSNIGKRGTPYQHRAGFCLETQHFPNSPNQPEFPTTELQPGEEYRSTTIYRFGTT